ncbi:MAG: nitroreductase family protein [Desulfobacterales bacterium]|nr:MAG: nitroreductase family protein [Desulfobacterales bacterium]
MSELLREIEGRRAKRALGDRKIPSEVAGRIMTAATYAPSCFNNQPWRFLVVVADEDLQKIHAALPDANYWVKKAPMVVVVATKPDLDSQLSDRRDYALFDCGLATANLVLQAFKEGLLAHPIAGFDPFKVKENFRIPDEFIVITLVAVGYPGDDTLLNAKHKQLEHGPRVRKPEADVICYDAWEFSASG